MVEKSGFVLYKDLIHTVQKLPMEKRGELFTTILEYVNDFNPEPEDLVIELVFEPIKQALKRDLEKYEKTKEKNRENIRKRWEKLKNNSSPTDTTVQSGIPTDTTVQSGIPTDTKYTDIGIDNSNSNSNSNSNRDSNRDSNSFLLEKETKEKKIKKDFSLENFPEEKNNELTTEFEERKKVAQKKERFNPPSIQEVQDYCNERQNGIQAFKFVNFYQSKGWKVGNQSMKDWKAAVRTWEQKNKENGNNQSSINGNSGSQNNGNKVSGTKEILSGARYTEFT